MMRREKGASELDKTAHRIMILLQANLRVGTNRCNLPSSEGRELEKHRIVKNEFIWCVVNTVKQWQLRKVTSSKRSSREKLELLLCLLMIGMKIMEIACGGVSQSKSLRI